MCDPGSQLANRLLSLSGLKLFDQPRSFASRFRALAHITCDADDADTMGVGYRYFLQDGRAIFRTPR